MLLFIFRAFQSNNDINALTSCGLYKVQYTLLSVCMSELVCPRTESVYRHILAMSFSTAVKGQLERSHFN